MFGRCLGAAFLGAVLILGGPAAASSLLQVIEAPPNVNMVEDLTLFDEFDSAPDRALLLIEGASVYTTCAFGVESVCAFDFGPDGKVTHLVAKAAGYQALYSVWDNKVTVDVNAWGPVYDPPDGCLTKNNGTCFDPVPAISNVRALIPEPGAVALFSTGLIVVGLALRRSGRR